MYPSLGILLGFEVRPYHLIRWTYFLLAALLTVDLNRRRGIRAGQTLAPFLIGIPAAMIGGHLLNVLEAWPAYRGRPGAILDVLSGGSSIFGALAFGVTAGVVALHWQRLRVRAFLDAAAPAMALGEAMTRVGCFLSGCCFGHPTDTWLGVAFPRGSDAFAAQVAAGLISPSNTLSLPVHPTQLYAAALSGLLFAVLLWMVWRPRSVPGAAFCTFLLGYGLERLVVGWWRADAVLYAREMSPALSLLTLMLAAALWWQWRFAEPAAPVTRPLAAERRTAGAATLRQ